MRSTRVLTAGLAVALLFSAVPASAGTELNEVAPFLVYPVVIGVGNHETFISITNASALPTSVHVSFIDGQARFSNGQPNPDYCFECDFDIDLTGNDTELLVLTNQVTGGISIESEDGTVSFSCDQRWGFIVVSAEDDTVFPPESVSSNVLLGSEVVVDYDDGYAFSVPAIPFQGLSNDGDRVYEFDDVEYRKFPRFVTADFIAPDLPNDPTRISAHLALFTLGFERQHPPEVDCSVSGYDAEENRFSDSFIFGCWTYVDLFDIATEFAYPNLGSGPGQNDTHGWLFLNCNVDQDPDDPADPQRLGGVHGAIVQHAESGAVIRRNDPTAPGVVDEVAWARLLYQSVTAGDSVTLLLEEPPGGLGGP